ncbi:MAG: hypothetical protein AAF570_15375, partial [Bacteroidota bacterium]
KKKKKKSLKKGVGTYPLAQLTENMLSTGGFEVVNVSGSGFNCLIRALLMAASGNVDELLVARVRQHLIQQGVTRRNQMLDMTDTNGLAAFTYLQAHGYLGSSGVVVHSPAHVLLNHQNANGDNLHIWLADNHFQAMVFTGVAAVPDNDGDVNLGGINDADL